MIKFFPRSFRDEFDQEILADLTDIERENQNTRLIHKVSVLRKEIAGWLTTALREQSSTIINRCRQFFKFLLRYPFNPTEVDMYRKEQKNGWNIEDKKVALIASLPPFLFGTAIWITWLVIGGPWYTATETQLKAGLASGLAVAAIIAIGGVWALIKRFSVWGYCWLGMDIVGFFLLAQGLVEETPIVLPGWAEALTAVVILGFSALVIIHAVLESWQAAGLVSIGLSTAMTLSSMYLIAVGPFHRVDLTILGPLCGLALSGLTYAYVRSSQLAQLGLISAIGLLNTVIVTIANQVWIAQMASTGKSAPLVSMLIFMLVMLLAGPVAGLFRKPMKTIIDRYFKN